MTRKKWLIVGGAVLLVCMIPIVGAAVFFFQPWLLTPYIPLYQFQRGDSNQAGYPLLTLTHGETTYVSDYTEYALSSPGYDRQIGQTTNGAHLYTIDGQKNYVVLYDFMDPVAVFRGVNQPPFDLNTLSVTGMQLASLAFAPGMGHEKNTEDSKLIQNVIATVTKGTPISSTVSVSDSHKYCLYLFGGDLTTMEYCVGAYLDNAGNVYVAKDTLSKEWYPANQLLSDWVQTP